MSLAFSRSMRSLEANPFRPTAWALLLVAILLVGWLVWFFLSHLGVYEVSRQARLEVESAVHPVEAPVSGRVLQSFLMLDRSVKAGEVLVELEAAQEELRLDEEQSRKAAFAAQLETLRAEIRAHEEALQSSTEAGRLSLDEARAELREAEAAAGFADEELKRDERLYDDGLRSEVDLLKSRSEVEKAQAAVERHRVAISRLEEQWGAEERDRRTEFERLQRIADELSGAVATSQETIRRLELEVGERLIRAPVTGRLGEVADIQVGRVVEKGERLCAVVPSGDAKVVAEFEPRDALGRIKSGQPARLRLDGFPWVQYGSVSASVTRVASETRNGTVRVELAVHPDPSLAIPLDHGLPGSVEIEVERITPATLLLRIAGRIVTRNDRPQTASADHR